MKIWDAFGELILEIMKKDHNKCSILRWKHPCAGFVTIIIKLSLVKLFSLEASSFSFSSHRRFKIRLLYSIYFLKTKI